MLFIVKNSHTYSISLFLSQIGLPVPIGSCKYDVQQLLDFLAEDPDFDCNKYLPGNGCSLPLLPGHYGGVFHGDDAIVIELPADLQIPDILKPFLNGKIKIHLSLESGGSEAVCINTEIGVSVQSYHALQYDYGEGCIDLLL